MSAQQQEHANDEAPDLIEALRSAEKHANNAYALSASLLNSYLLDGSLDETLYDLALSEISGCSGHITEVLGVLELPVIPF